MKRGLTRKLLAFLLVLTMMECQRTDGWFPRQYSAKGRHGKHDLRTQVGGSAFFVEFIYKYLAQPGILIS